METNNQNEVIRGGDMRLICRVTMVAAITQPTVQIYA